MSETEDTVETPYGRLDRAALTKARESYDTAALLRIIGELNEFMAAASLDDGLADMLQNKANKGSMEFGIGEGKGIRFGVNKAHSFLSGLGFQVSFGAFELRSRSIYTRHSDLRVTP